MTVSKDYNKHVYEGNGLTVDWPYDFDLPITAAGTPDTSLIHVFRTNLRGEVTEVTAFSVDAETGTLTYPTSGSPLETGEKLTILRLLDVRQQFFDPSNQANLYPETLEDNTDRLVMLVQQLQEETDRAVKVGLSTDLETEDITAEGIFEARDIALSAAETAEGYANMLPAIADELDVNIVVDEADLRAKLAAIGASNASLVIATTIPIAADLAIPSNVALSFKRPGQLQPAVGTTLTINGPIDAGLWQIFGGEGTVTGAPGVPCVYPEWFGAVGDGLTDDSASFTSLVAASLSRDVYLTNTYSIFNITLTSDIAFHRGTLKCQNEPEGSSRNLLNSVSDISIELIGVELDGNASTWSSNDDPYNMLRFIGCNKVHISHCEIHHFAQSDALRWAAETDVWATRPTHVAVFYNCDNVTVERCDIHDLNGVECLVFGSCIAVQILNNHSHDNWSAYALYKLYNLGSGIVDGNVGTDQYRAFVMMMSKNLQITNNRFYHTTSRGLASENTGYAAVSNCVISGNLLARCGQGGIDGVGSHSIITNNRIVDCCRDQDNLIGDKVGAIRVVGKWFNASNDASRIVSLPWESNTPDPDIDYVNDVIISNNEIVNFNFNRGITIFSCNNYAVYQERKNIKITDNYIHAVADDCRFIFADNMGAFDGLDITGNTMIMDGEWTSPSTHFISLVCQAHLKNVRISRNTFRYTLRTPVNSLINMGVVKNVSYGNVALSSNIEVSDNFCDVGVSNGFCIFSTIGLDRYYSAQIYGNKASPEHCRQKRASSPHYPTGDNYTVPTIHYVSSYDSLPEGFTARENDRLRLVAPNGADPLEKIVQTSGSVFTTPVAFTANGTSGDNFITATSSLTGIAVGDFITMADTGAQFYVLYIDSTKVYIDYVFSTNFSGLTFNKSALALYV